MSKNEEFEIEQMMMETPRGSEAPSEVKARLRSMAAYTKVRKISPWPARLAFGGVASIAAIFIGISMVPVPASAKTFDKILAATQRADRFQFTVDSTQTGKEHKLMIAGENGKFRIQAEEGAVIQINGAKMEIYDVPKNTLMSISLDGMIDPKMIADEIRGGVSEGLKEMDLKKMLSDFRAKYGQENVHLGPTTDREGRRIFEVTMHKPGETEQVDMIVNADTYLPERVEVSGGQGREEHLLMEMKYGDAVHVDFDNSAIPPGAKRVDLNIGKMIEGKMKGLDPFGKGKD